MAATRWCWVGLSFMACGRPESPAEPPTPAPSTTGVTLLRTPQGLRAHVQLSEVTRTFALIERPTIRRDDWSADGASFEGNRVHANTPTAQFELVVPVNAQEHDRVYPSLTRVGEGYVVYGPALLSDQLPSDVRATTGGGDVVVPAEAALAEGYVFIGPPDLIESRRGYRLIGAATVPSWISEAATEGAEAAFPFFASYLGPLATEPVLALSADSPGPMGSHGDVTDNAFVFLRFHGMQWKDDDADAAARINTFIRHEAFHLWNGGAALKTAPWLHEGGAEYAAIVAAVTSKVLSEADGLDQISARAAACRAQLGDRPFSELASRGSSLYDCGVLAQWLADLSRRRESRGREHTLTLWATLMAEASKDGYDLEGFRALAGPLTVGLLDGKGFAWLFAALADLGVTVDDSPGANLDRSDLLVHLLRSSCGPGGIGFWTEDGFVRLDTGDACGVLSNQPEITAIESHDIIDAPSAAMEAAVARCEAGHAVRASLREGGTVEIPCAAPPSRSPGFRVVEAPSLAVPPR